MNENGIDFVVLWVDDQDPQWQAERQKYKSEDTGFMNPNECRYRDWGLLPYWFRSVEKYAPWVRKIHFVTCGHYPEWLNLEHPKLNFVRHEDFIPSEYLPTFSSYPIELNLHRIKDLSEQFVYFNDDMYVTAPVKPTDFFVDGLPRDLAVSSIPMTDEIGLNNLNCINIINREFNFHAQFKKHWRKWLNYRYGARCLICLFFLHWHEFTGVKNTHVANSYLKSTFVEVWEKYGKELDKTSRNRFSTPMDVNQWLMKYWQIVGGTFFPQRHSFGREYHVVSTKQIERAIKKKTYKLLCVNDSRGLKDISQVKKEITEIFQREFPDKSSFEL